MENEAVSQGSVFEIHDSESSEDDQMSLGGDTKRSNLRKSMP